ncbi:hypothetical protein VPH35_125404 [Triticum aestivum]
MYTCYLTLALLATRSPQSTRVRRPAPAPPSTRLAVATLSPSASRATLCPGRARLRHCIELRVAVWPASEPLQRSVRLRASRRRSFLLLLHAGYRTVPVQPPASAWPRLRPLDAPLRLVPLSRPAASRPAVHSAAAGSSPALAPAQLGLRLLRELGPGRLRAAPGRLSHRCPGRHRCRAQGPLRSSAPCARARAGSSGGARPPSLSDLALASPLRPRRSSRIRPLLPPACRSSWLPAPHAGSGLLLRRPWLRPPLGGSSTRLRLLVKHPGTSGSACFSCTRVRRAASAMCYSVVTAPTRQPGAPPPRARTSCCRVCHAGSGLPSRAGCSSARGLLRCSAAQPRADSASSGRLRLAEPPPLPAAGWSALAGSAGSARLPAFAARLPWPAAANKRK